MLGALATLVRNTTVHLAGERIAARLRKRVFAAVLHQRLAFFDRTRTGVCDVHIHSFHWFTYSALACLVHSFLPLFHYLGADEPAEQRRHAGKLRVEMGTGGWMR